jgi:hypothetical protein
MQSTPWLGHTNSWQLQKLQQPTTPWLQVSHLHHCDSPSLHDCACFMRPVLTMLLISGGTHGEIVTDTDAVQVSVISRIVRTCPEQPVQFSPLSTYRCCMSRVCKRLLKPSWHCAQPPAMWHRQPPSTSNG